MKLFRKIGSLIAILATTVSGLIGVVTATWNAGSDNQNDNANTASQTITGTASEPICYRKSGSTIIGYYNSISKALSDATSGQKVFVMSGKTITVNEDLEVKNGVELVLPYNSSESTMTFAGSATSSRNIMLTMANNADINVKTGGTLTIGGVLGTRGLIGAYSEINLSAGSSIMVNGTMNAYGKVTEKSQVTGYVSADNIVYDNSRDSGRFIKVTSSGSVNTTIGCYDIGGGTALTNKIDKGVCPTYNFEFPTLQTYVTVQHGGNLSAYAFVSIAGNDVNALCGVVFPSSAESNTKSMFYQNSGEINIEWCNTNKTILYMNGNVKMGYLYVKGAMGYNIDTSNIFIGLTSRYCVFIGGTFDTNNKKIKFLPGSFVKVLSTGTISINGTSNSSKSQVLFYEGNSFTSLGITTYGNTNSTLINNGTIISNQYGCIAGYIDTEVTNGNALVDLSAITNSANISLTTNEIVNGESANIPTIDLKGPFYDANNSGNDYRTDSLFSIGNSYNSKNGYASWEGDITQLVNISLTVTRTGAKTESYNYSIYSNTSASNSGQTTIMSNVVNVRTQNFTLVQGEYIKIVDTTCTEIKVNGSTYTSGTWVQVQSDLTIEIIPTAAFNVRVYHTHGNSGAGYIKRSVTWGPTSSNMSESKSVSNGSEINVNIPAGWVFKVSDDANVSGTSQVKKTTYNEQGVGTTVVLSSSSGSVAWSSSTIYTADGDYIFVSDNVTCITKDALVTLANGTQTRAENLHIGDLLKTWSFETGGWVIEPIIFLEEIKDVEATIIKVKFDDNSHIDICWAQGFFDADLLDYFIINIENYEDVIGRRVLAFNGETPVKKTIVDVVVEEQFTSTYEIHTGHGYQFVANNVLTIEPLINEHVWFTVNEDYKYDEELMRQDLETYGVLPYEVFADYVTEEQYDLFNGQYLAVPIGKGYFTFEELMEIIKHFLPGNI